MLLFLTGAFYHASFECFQCLPAYFFFSSDDGDGDFDDEDDFDKMVASSVSISTFLNPSLFFPLNLEEIWMKWNHDISIYECRMMKKRNHRRPLNHADHCKVIPQVKFIAASLVLLLFKPNEKILPSAPPHPPQLRCLYCRERRTLLTLCLQRL